MRTRSHGSISLALSGLLPLLQACVTGGSAEPVAGALPEPITIMSYNVENLFDTVHDDGKNDWTFLPLSLKTDQVKQACKESSIKEKYYKECISRDWNEDLLREKLQRVAKVILSQNNGKGPDILFLVEVENIKILERLRQDYLKDAQYLPAVLLEGPDERGIDAAFLSRMPLDGEPTLHPVKLSKVDDPASTLERTSRSILQADFKLPGGDRLSAFAVHFPAGFHPTAHRLEALAVLNEAAKRTAVQSQVVVAAGDFNINRREEKALYQDLLAKDWFVSHLVGCQSCQGSYYLEHEKEWSFLDAITVLKNGTAPGRYAWKMDPESIKVVNENYFQKKMTGVPLRFILDSKGNMRGVSDHFPMLMKLKAERPASNP
ncbi:MAG TPA: endonuclease/exonuclease/phosphatase family protein [Oligoflexus sp.]|uniref:endonuclease/exonuclease/phosphatase family protein n=1 Tax=Oligoflexus sp. TaxID=1971216 RepID=UPI002D67E3EE|nr:endonuclease/exonuclease/phosphatase family protein [Oligoflexus sp.]HYX33301.1 endonuclease/exonuclease/phosphatase family protein [Oligoflexus sp.]